ncbi:MAG: polynucleotide 5'-hydroxyl-kinase [Nitrososphaerota archaeon]
MLTEAQSIHLSPHTTLVLKGPASARILEGRVEVFGYSPGQKERIIARPWRSLPLYSDGGAVVEVLMGTGGSVETVEGNTIPSEWTDVVTNLGESFRVMVVGGVDTGKTSLLTYLYNRLVPKGGTTIVDLDVGQSEICPPTTMAVATGTRPSPTFSSFKPATIYPYGYTSPSYAIRHSLKTVTELASSIESAGRVLINTDGWIDHERAREYKSQLIKIFKPSHVVLIGVGNPGEMVESALEVGAKVFNLPGPGTVLRRDQEARKQIREMNYTRFLRGARLVSTPRRWLKATPLLSASISIEDYLGAVVKELEEAGVERAPLIEGVDMSEAGLGILSYINSQGRRAHSLALFIGIDGKGLARIYTPHEGPIQELEVGALVLSTSFKEVFTYLPPIE